MDFLRDVLHPRTSFTVDFSAASTTATAVVDSHVASPAAGTDGVETLRFWTGKRGVASHGADKEARKSWVEARAASDPREGRNVADGVSPRDMETRVDVESVVSTRVDGEVGEVLARCEKPCRQRDTAVEVRRPRSAEGEDGEDGEVGVMAEGKQKRSIAWAVVMGRKILRRVSGLRVRWKKSSSPGCDISMGESEMAALLGSSSEAVSAEMLRESDRVVSCPDSPSSADLVNRPNPDYPDPISYFSALAACVEEKRQRGLLDEDVIDFRFAGAPSNQEEGQEGLFHYDTLGSSPRASVSIQDAAVNDIRAFGPAWARRAVERWEEACSERTEIV